MNEDKILEFLETSLNNDLCDSHDNVKNLIMEYKRNKKRLDTIVKQSDGQQHLLLQLNEELNSYKNHLEIKVEEEINKRKEKETMLLQQSRLAAIGEMIDAVAHQWKQPLNNISMRAGILRFDYEDGVIDKEYINKFDKNISTQIIHMSDTLDEFRTFFRPDKTIKEFNIKEMIDKVLILIKDEFKQYDIQISVNNICDFNLIGIENEFRHLILNVLNNAKDAFIEKNIQIRHIDINIVHENKMNKIEIVDNAGGIPESLIKDIFKANYTTKQSGTGIGLYMSQLIANKHNGILKANNVKEGSKFTIEFTNS